MKNRSMRVPKRPIALRIAKHGKFKLAKHGKFKLDSKPSKRGKSKQFRRKMKRKDGMIKRFHYAMNGCMTSEIVALMCMFAKLLMYKGSCQHQNAWNVGISLKVHNQADCEKLKLLRDSVKILLCWENSPSVQHAILY